MASQGGRWALSPIRFMSRHALVLLSREPKRSAISKRTRSRVYSANSKRYCSGDFPAMVLQIHFICGPVTFGGRPGTGLALRASSRRPGTAPSSRTPSSGSIAAPQRHPRRAAHSASLDGADAHLFQSPGFQSPGMSMDRTQIRQRSIEITTTYRTVSKRIPMDSPSENFPEILLVPSSALQYILL